MSSTPYSSMDKEKTKKALGFDEYDMHQKVTVTTMTRTIDKKKDEEVMMGEADSDDDEVVKAQCQQDEEASVPAPAPHTTFSPSWMAIGWKEVALATVLTGIGVVGYVCYVTDYCSFC